MTIEVKITGHEYNIEIERGILNRAGEHMNLNRKVLIVTDTGVPAQYSKTLAAQCKEAHITTIEQGEASKNFANFELILSEMLDFGMVRSDCVVAVGGGVIGDMAGFAAACYMRGVDFYNIPTTVLSQVDSSVGGKTAIDFKGVKNVVGAFYQPRCVLIDPDTLKTLPDRQISNGLAEAVKMAMTCDGELFEYIENCENVWDNIDTIIARAVDIKRNVVEQDEKEKSLRRVLNFGHTLGHGIEVAAHNRLYHGEAVSIGMLPMCSDSARARLIPVLDKLKLPTHFDIDIDVANEAVTHDKKAGSSFVKAVFVPEVGSFEFKDMSFEELKAKMSTVVTGA